jgi:hypothetical protein
MLRFRIFPNSLQLLKSSLILIAHLQHACYVELQGTRFYTFQFLGDIEESEFRVTEDSFPPEGSGLALHSDQRPSSV